MIKMFRKRVSIIFVLIMFISLLGNYKLTTGMAGDYKKIVLTLDNISWILNNQINETAEFKITSFVTINNPNDYPVDLTFPTPVIQMIGTNVSINVDDEQLSGYFLCICGGFEQVLDYRTVQPGDSYNTSISYLYVYNWNSNTIPDGTYLFWNYIYGQNDLVFTSNKVLVTVKDGIETIDYNYGVTSNTSIQKLIPLISSAFIVIIAVITKKRRKRDVIP